jgi:hypothetical protein
MSGELDVRPCWVVAGLVVSVLGRKERRCKVPAIFARNLRIQIVIGSRSSPPNHPRARSDHTWHLFYGTAFLSQNLAKA